MRGEPSKQELGEARESPCVCECQRCDQGSHCGHLRLGCRWYRQRRSIRRDLLASIRPS